MDFDVISKSLKKAVDVFVANVVAYIVGFLITMIGSCLIVTMAPLMFSLYRMAIKGSRGEKVEIKDIFYGFSSGSIFIRSWIGFLGFMAPFIVIMVAYAIISAILAAIKLGFIAIFLYFVVLIIFFVLMIFLYFTMFIYVMTPSQNIIFALKESFGISKSNIVMTILTIIIAGFCGILFVTAPLGYIFAVYMLKDSLAPGIKDES